MTTVIDCIRSPTTAAMRAAGVVGLTRYLSWTDRDSLGKVIRRAEFDRLTGDGFGLALNWEYAATDWLGGASAGLAHGTEAVRQARALGYPAGCAIYGSADLDMTLAQWNGPGKTYAREFAAVVRGAGYRAGPYGPYDVLTWCRDAGYADVYWQAGMSTAWSGHRNANAWPGAHLRQRHQQTIGGQDCDVNDILQPDWGQYQRGHTPMGADMALTPEERAALIAGNLTDDNVLHADLRMMRDNADPLVAKLPFAKDLLPAPGLKQLGEKIDAVALDAHAAANRPTVVTLTDADRAAIAADVGSQVGARIDALAAQVGRLLTAVAAGGQAEADALKPPA